MNVSAAGTMDADCPIWDHVVQLFVCCEDEHGSMAQCNQCDVTPWLALAQHGALPFQALPIYQRPDHAGCIRMSTVAAKTQDRQFHLSLDWEFACRNFHGDVVCSRDA